MGSLAAVQPRKHTRVRANKRRCRSTVSKIFPFASAEPVRDQAVLTVVCRLAADIYCIFLGCKSLRGVVCQLPALPDALTNVAPLRLLLVLHSNERVYGYRMHVDPESDDSNMITDKMYVCVR